MGWTLVSTITNVSVKNKSIAHIIYSITDRWVEVEAKLEKELGQSLFLCSLKPPLHLHSCIVLLEGKLLLLLTRPVDLSHSKFTSDLCDGHVPFVSFLKATRIQSNWSKAERRINYFVKEATQKFKGYSELSWSVRTTFSKLVRFCWLASLLKDIIFCPLDFQMLSLIENRWIAGQ